MKQLLTDIITESEIQEMLYEYHGSDVYESSSMNKLKPGPATDFIDDFVTGYKRVGGNYYMHSTPYLPHTDHKKEWNESINVIVPLYVENNASLVVFDQRYYHDSVTWCLHNDLIEFKYNTGVLGRPYDYDIKGKTEKNISDDLYELLDWAPKEQWFGLTGDAFEFIPGNVLIFDNKHIHATSKFEGSKIGLSLRYAK